MRININPTTVRTELSASGTRLLADDLDGNTWAHAYVFHNGLRAASAARQVQLAGAIGTDTWEVLDYAKDEKIG